MLLNIGTVDFPDVPQGRFAFRIAGTMLLELCDVVQPDGYNPCIGEYIVCFPGHFPGELLVLTTTFEHEHEITGLYSVTV